MRIHYTAALWLLAMSAHAQVYKCPSADGAITYSDAPCTGGRQIERQKSQGEIMMERQQAARAAQRTAAQDQRTLNAMQAPAAQYSQGNSGGGGGQVSGGSSQDCSRAQREVEMASNIVTGSKDTRASAIAAANRKADMACFGAAKAGEIRSAEVAAPKPTIDRRTPVMQPAAPTAKFCSPSGNGTMFCY